MLANFQALTTTAQHVNGVQKMRSRSELAFRDIQSHLKKKPTFPPRYIEGKKSRIAEKKSYFFIPLEDSLKIPVIKFLK